jgi:HTH-type transcriptional regulator, competence development regulator
MKNNFGNYLKKLRLDRNLSLRDVEKKAKISNAYLSQVERGERSIPTLRILSRIAEAYGVDLSELAKKAEQEFSNKADNLDATPNPEREFIYRGYDGLSDENKRNLHNYLKFLVDQERGKWNKEIES